MSDELSGQTQETIEATRRMESDVARGKLVGLAEARKIAMESALLAIKTSTDDRGGDRANACLAIAAKIEEAMASAVKDAVRDLIPADPP